MSANARIESDGETCLRCGDVGEDRRTLYMACLYDMSELKVPFEQVMIRGTRHKMTGTKELRFSDNGPGHFIPVFDETPEYPKSRDYQMFTLRVCKGCRSDWMGAIKDWFNRPPIRKESCGSGIFIRKNGAIVEITEEEWAQRSSGREPVRMR